MKQLIRSTQNSAELKKLSESYHLQKVKVPNRFKAGRGMPPVNGSGMAAADCCAGEFEEEYGDVSPWEVFAAEDKNLPQNGQTVMTGHPVHGSALEVRVRGGEVRLINAGIGMQIAPVPTMSVEEFQNKYFWDEGEEVWISKKYQSASAEHCEYEEDDFDHCPDCGFAGYGDAEPYDPDEDCPECKNWGHGKFADEEEEDWDSEFEEDDWGPEDAAYGADNWEDDEEEYDPEVHGCPMDDSPEEYDAMRDPDAEYEEEPEMSFSQYVGNDDEECDPCGEDDDQEPCGECEGYAYLESGEKCPSCNGTGWQQKAEEEQEEDELDQEDDTELSPEETSMLKGLAAFMKQWTQNQTPAAELDDDQDTEDNEDGQSLLDFDDEEDGDAEEQFGGQLKSFKRLDDEEVSDEDAVSNEIDSYDDADEEEEDLNLDDTSGDELSLDSASSGDERESDSTEDDLSFGNTGEEDSEDSDLDLEGGEDEVETEQDPNYQGSIRVVDNAHLVYKREDEDGTYSELWVYNNDHEDNNLVVKIRKDILSGTDIDLTTGTDENQQQQYELTKLGNINYLHITGLSN